MRVEVQIDFNKNQETVLSLGTPLPEGNNVSHIEKILDNTLTGYKAFLLTNNITNPTTKADGTVRLFDENGYPGFMSKTVGSNVVIPIVINGTAPDNLYIIFDAAYKEYATQFTITYQNQTISYTNSSVYTRVSLTPFNISGTLQNATFTLTIQAWSRANASVKIMRVSVFPLAVYTGGDIIDIICSENAFDSQMTIQPGLCEQYADLKLYDRTNDLHYLAQAGKLLQDYSVSVNIIDTETEETTCIGSYVVSDWDINSNNSVVKVSCRDISYILSKLNFIPTVIRNRSVHDMLLTVFNQSKFNWRYIDDETRVYCENIVTPNSWFKEGDLATVLQKICYLGMLRIYWYQNMFIVMRCY